MARQEKKKDVVVVGLGWTGSIAAMELSAMPGVTTLPSDLLFP